jgi:hypothetical protein
MRTRPSISILVAAAGLTTADAVCAGESFLVGTKPMSAVGRNHQAGTSGGGATVNDHRTHDAELVLRVPVTVTNMDRRAAAVVVRCRGQGGSYYNETRPVETDTSGGNASMPLTDAAFKGTIAVPMYKGSHNAVRGTHVYGCELFLKTKESQIVPINAFGLDSAGNNVTKVSYFFRWG